MIGIYCAGSLGGEILDILMNECGYEKNQISFIDDVVVSDLVWEVNTYSFENFIDKYDVDSVEGIVIATGEPKYRGLIRNKVRKNKYKLMKIISQRAYIGRSAIIEDGVVVFPFCYIGYGAWVKENTIIHVGAKVESNTIVGKDSVISLGAFLGAEGKYGNQIFFGPHASAFDHIKVADFSIIGMNSAVTKDIVKSGVYVGNPARYIKENEGRVFKHNIVASNKE